MNANSHASESTRIDPDDAPELTDDWFAGADLREGEKVLRHGRPKAGARTVLLSIRYSQEVVDYFRATGDGWQVRMDEALKEWTSAHAGR